MLKDIGFKDNVEEILEKDLAVGKICYGQFLLDLKVGLGPILFPVHVKLKVKVVLEMDEC